MNLNGTELKIRRIRTLLILFIAGLVLSGLTAFPIETQLLLLKENPSLVPGFTREWINQVYSGVHEVNDKYPFISYGTDWLGFAHLVIAIAFIGPLRDPLKNIWVIQFGLIACIGVIPLALIAGPIRQIPFYHQLIDISFGVIGFIPLFFAYRLTRKLEQISI